MRALQVIVVVMGVLIVVTTGVVIAVIVGRISRHEAAPNRFIAQPVAIPHGAKVTATTASGDRLLVTLSLADGGQRVIILDLKTGIPLGTIDLRPAP